MFVAEVSSLKSKCAGRINNTFSQNIQFIAIIFFCSCNSVREENKIAVKDTVIVAETDTIAVFSELEQRLIDDGLVDIRSLDSTIMVDLRYSSENNFLGKDIYGDLNNCYVQKDVAEKVLNAQRLLKYEFPQYSLLILDGVRPRSIQTLMWEELNMPDSEKIKYVSNPRFGSLHNFGAAVDVTVTDANGKELDMGTPFDFFGELAYPVKEQEFLRKGELTSAQIENRRLLRRIMYGSGFFNIQTEWWHFNSCYRKEAAEKYKIIE